MRLRDSGLIRTIEKVFLIAETQARFWPRSMASMNGSMAPSMTF